MQTHTRALIGGPYDGATADVPMPDGQLIPVTLYTKDTDPPVALGTYVADEAGVYRWREGG